MIWRGKVVTRKTGQIQGERPRRPTEKVGPSRTIVTNTPDDNKCTVVNRETTSGTYVNKQSVKGIDKVLTCKFMNARNIVNKTMELEEIIYEEDPDIILITVMDLQKSTFLVIKS